MNREFALNLASQRDELVLRENPLVDQLKEDSQLQTNEFKNSFSELKLSSLPSKK